MDLLASAAATILGPESELNSDGPREQPSSFLVRKRPRRMTFDDLASTMRDFHDMSDRRIPVILKVFSSKNTRRFCMREFFTSAVDWKYYFAKDDFMDCLRTVGLGHIGALRRKEWSAVRGIICSKLGHPRRFSQAFLRSERRKLYDSRNECRQNSEDPPVSVGDVVTVRDMNTQMLFRGLILSSAEMPAESASATTTSSSPSMHSYGGPSSFIVQLDRPELGIEIYEDMDILVNQRDSPKSNAELYRAGVFSLSSGGSSMAMGIGGGIRRNLSTHSLTSSMSVSHSHSQAGLTTQIAASQHDDYKNDNTNKNNKGDENDSVSNAGSAPSETENDDENENDETVVFMSSQQLSAATNGTYNHITFGEPKDVILRKCGDSIKKVWPGFMKEAEEFITRDVERLVGQKYPISEVLPDEDLREVMIRALGGLLFIRSAKDKWDPRYAEPVLVSIASDMCEGCDVKDFRLIMNYFASILSQF